MSIPIRTIEGALASMYSVDGPTVVRARLQHLNVRNFPPGLRVGRAKRAEYGFAEATAYSVWFALAQAFVPLGVAADIVCDGWPEIVKGVLSVGLPDLVTLPMIGSSRPVIIVTPRALENIAATDRQALACGPWDLHIVADVDTTEMLQRCGNPSIIIDLNTLYLGLTDALSCNEDFRDGRRIADEVDALASEEGWLTQGGSGVLHTREAPFRERGDRLVETDYYFARALFILNEISEPPSAGMSPRAERYLSYLSDPLPRERWKARARVGLSEAGFGDGMMSLIRQTFENVSQTGPEALATAATAIASAAGLEEPVRLANALRSTAEVGRNLEAVLGDREEA